MTEALLWRSSHSRKKSILSEKSQGLEQSFVKSEILYNCEAKSVWQLPNLFKEVRAVLVFGSVRRFGGEGSYGAPTGLCAKNK